jgi:hypothetical protein
MLQMKLLILLLSLNLFNYNCFSQSLEGEWNGSFTYAEIDPKMPYYTFQTNQTPIKLTFVLNTDSSYSVYSYSNGRNSQGRDTTYVCAILFKKISSDSIYLEEMRIIKPENVPFVCGQKIYLKFEKLKRRLTLEGIWKTNPNTCGHSGEIRLSRKNE